MKFKFWYSPLKQGRNYEEFFSIEDMGFDAEEWEDLSEAEQEQQLEMYCRDTLLSQYFDYGYSKEQD